MITVFARPSANDKREVPPGVLELPTKKMRLTSEGDPMEPLSKNAHEPQQEVPEEVLPMDSQPEDSVNPPSSTLDQLQDSIIQHGPRFLALPIKTRQWLSKIHHNLGHPSINKLQNVLQQQGFADEIVQGAGDFKCSTCVETQAPRISRPASLSEPREFNDCVGCDLISWTSRNGKVFQFVHLIDMATNFQLASMVFQTDASTLFETIQECWFKWAGPCKQLVVDNESALCSDEFTKHAQSSDIHLRVVAAYAHWQLGKTERHGDILQHMLERFDVDQTISTNDEFRKALQQCCNAKNSLARSKGYTPEILVLGKSQCLPGSVCEDVPKASHFLYESDTPEGLAFRKHLEYRECARRAFAQADNSEKLRRAFLRRQRPHRGRHIGGSFVMFWRPGKGEYRGQWHGPARVIIQESDHVVWISFSSRVYRVAPEHIRSLSLHEAQQSMEQLATSRMDFPDKDHGKGVFQYEDLTQQAGPTNFPETEESESAPTVALPPEPPTISSEGDNMEQPDSEPNMPPASQASSGYTPTTPINDRISDDLGEEPIPAAPHEVPVPSDDDFVVEDVWMCQGDKLLRIHNRPRWTDFDPSSCADCPVDILNVMETRCTTGNHAHGGIWSKTDSWCSNKDDDHWTTQEPWTGITVFTIMMNGGKTTEPFQDVLHVQDDQALECEIFFTAGDLETIGNEPDAFPLLAASAAKRQRAEVKLKDLSPSQLAEFQAAKNKEIDQWLATETVRKILRHKIPEENILKCRWVLTWKDLDPIDAAKEGKSRKAKARLVILGYMDPDLTDIPRDSPTLQKESRALLLQYCAARRWVIQSFDVKTAFLRGSRRDNRILGVEPPPELRAKLNMKETETCELLKSAYGLVNAPYLWYVELKESLLELQFQISPLDPCLFCLVGKQGQVHGLIGMHVDDGLCCGDETFERTLNQLENKFPFGSKRRQDFTFTGIHINQDENYNIHLNQTDYVLAIDPIHIERTRRKHEQMEVTEGERQSLRGIIGSLQYAATNTRPDLSARLSFLQSRINCATIRDLLDANRLLGDAKHYATVTISISSIDVDDVRFVSYSDASFATREKQHSQKGGLFLAVHQDVFLQKSARASPLCWFSKKIDRVVASTLAAETYALCSSVDLTNWLRLSWEWIKNPNIPWQTPEKVWHETHPSIAVVDCKSLFDAITKNTTPQCQEHRTLIEALVIKSHLNSGIKPYWVHSAAQLSDALTKVMDCFRIREFLQHRRCCLHDMDETLKQRADRKAFKTWLSNAVAKDQSSNAEAYNRST
jgi:hypothetical protein